MPPANPRRTSCVRCVRGKRKCDAARPKCGRCSRVDAACQYLSEHDDAGVRTSSAAAIRLPESMGEIQTVRLGPDFSSARYLSQSIRLPRDRLVYCVRRLRECPVQMVRDGHTLFVRQSARAEALAPPLQEAYTACAVYCCRTPDNAEIVRMLVTRKYHELVHSSPGVSLGVELAQVQAVVLLHIIHLFDGHGTLRTEGEKCLDNVRGRILRLQRHAELEMLDDRQYSEWMLAENIRRTILAATFVESIYLSLREGICTTLPFMSLLPIAVPGGLWMSKDERDWHEVLGSTGGPTVSYGEAVEVWSKPAQTDALEDLQQILFAACKGLPSTAARDTRSCAS